MKLHRKVLALAEFLSHFTWFNNLAKTLLYSGWERNECRKSGRVSLFSDNLFANSNIMCVMSLVVPVLNKINAASVKKLLKAQFKILFLTVFLLPG